MEELDFDSWADYVPVGNDAIVPPKEVHNPNLMKLSIDDDYELFEFTKRDFKQCFDNSSECDYDESKFMRFIKDDEKNGVTIFHCRKNEDVCLLIKDDKKYVFCVYQNTGYYEDDNKLTFTGWDYNIIVDIDEMTFKTKYVR